MKQMQDKIFIDSNIFLYAFSNKDTSKKHIAENIITNHNTISTQVINEVSNNMIKKLNFDNSNIEKFIIGCYQKYKVVNFSQDIFIKSIKIRELYNISHFDSLIVSSALQSSCNILYSEDMHHNQLIENKLKIINPFV
jgi:predicted nucleic acid-binding protein